MKTYFEFAKHHTDYKKETLAGLTTFLTMSYIIVVNPRSWRQRAFRRARR